MRYADLDVDMRTRRGGDVDIHVHMRPGTRSDDVHIDVSMRSAIGDDDIDVRRREHDVGLDVTASRLPLDREQNVDGPGRRRDLHQVARVVAEVCIVAERDGVDLVVRPVDVHDDVRARGRRGLSLDVHDVRADLTGWMREHLDRVVLRHDDRPAMTRLDVLARDGRQVGLRLDRHACGSIDGRRRVVGLVTHAQMG
jgi:hypothetical protein